MKFYYIWAKLYSFELKNTKDIDIRNYKDEPQKCNKNEKYSKVSFGPHWFYLVHYVHFGPFWSYSVHTILIDPFGPI